MDQIAQLLKLNAKALKAHWRALFGNRPIPRIGRGVTIMAMAYRLQEKQYGGFSRTLPSSRHINWPEDVRNSLMAYRSGDQGSCALGKSLTSQLKVRYVCSAIDSIDQPKLCNSYPSRVSSQLASWPLLDEHRGL